MFQSFYQRIYIFVACKKCGIIGKVIHLSRLNYIKQSLNKYWKEENHRQILEELGTS